MMRQALKRVLPKRAIHGLRQGLARVQDPDLPFLYPYVVGVLGKLLAPRQPPILIVSLPRSGSSWVGSIIGSSDDSLYLREPLTSTYLRLFPSAPAFFEIDVCEDRARYRRFAEDAFSGVPCFDMAVVPYPSQWDYRSRSKRRVVIKEVNPLVLDWFVTEYDPRVIYLIRHPVAVANSSFVQGWTSGLFRREFSVRTLSDLQARFRINLDGDFWEQSGALQAIVENIVVDVLSSASDFMVVKYEDLCAAPLEQFTKLFQFCELDLASEIAERIEDTTRSRGPYSPGEAGIVRNSVEMINRWRSLPERNIKLVRRGYFANHPHHYLQDW